MAENPSDHISCFLRLSLTEKYCLGTIRHWSNVKMAYDGDDIWLTGFDEAQIHAPEVKSIPYACSYTARNGKLYRLHSLLPVQNIPSLLWTPIERALPVQIPLTNSNYFGIRQHIEPKLVTSKNEHPAAAMMISLATLGDYIHIAPSVRISRMEWAIIGHDALIAGTPVLPVNGDVFWQNGDFLIPAGYDFDLPVLSGTINKVFNPQGHRVVWRTDSSYILVDKRCFRPLTISSYKQSADEPI